MSPDQRGRTAPAALGSRIAALALFALAAATNHALASVLALSPVGTDNTYVVNVDTHDAVLLQIPHCCAVQSGSVAADTLNHRVFFIANDGGFAALYIYTYGVPSSVDSIGLGSGQRVSHMVYDPLHQRLAAIIADDSGGIELATLARASGVVVTGVLGPDCCQLRAGVAAYDAVADIFYAVGRRSTDSADQLFAFSIANGTLLAAYPLGSESVSALALDGGLLYALSYDAATDALRAATITFTPGFALTPIGSGAAGCCFVLAGSIALDHTRNALVALTRASTSAEAFAIRAFSLTDGTVMQGNALNVNGLFEDSVTLSDRIFADDFEGP